MTPGAWLGRVAMIVVAVFFVLFFVIPIVWLLLASTKSPHDLITTGPFTAGSLSDLAANWNALVTFQDGIVFRWLGNSAYYSLAALVITLVTTIPAGYALALSELPRTAAAAHHDAGRDAHPEHGARAADLPRAVRRRADRQAARRDPAVLVLPVRRLPHLHLLLDERPARPARRRPHRRLRRARGLPAGRDAAGHAGDRAGRLLQLRGELEQLLPAVPHRPGPGGHPSRSASPTCSRTSRRSTRRLPGVTAIELPTLAVATLLSVLPVLLIFLFSQRFLVAGLTAGGTKE